MCEKDEKKNIKNPHDRFFKELFSEKAVMSEFISKTFPEEIVKNINLKSLKLENTSYLDENLQTTYSDMVYNCVYNNETKINVTLLFEHKSFYNSYPHFQLLSYILRIWEKQLKDKVKLTPVIPIIFYHGKNTFSKKSISEYFGKDVLDDNLKKFIPNFDYILIDTNEFTNEEIKGLFDEISLRIGILLMKNIFIEKEIVSNMNKFFSEVKELFKTEKGKKFFSQIVAYLFYTTKIKTHIFSEKMSEISEEAGKKFISTADRLISKGMKKGKKEGLKEGMEKGMEKGIAKTVEITVFNLIKKGLDNNFIKDVTSLNIKEIKKLRKLV